MLVCVLLFLYIFEIQNKSYTLGIGIENNYRPPNIDCGAKMLFEQSIATQLSTSKAILIIAITVLIWHYSSDQNCSF